MSLTGRSVKNNVVDIDISIVKGRGFLHGHRMRLHPSYAVELELNGETKQTLSGKSKGGDVSGWNTNILFSADTSSNIKFRVYCKHQRVREDHIIGETSFEPLSAPRYEDFELELYDPAPQTGQKTSAGYITLLLKVAVADPVAFGSRFEHAVDFRSKSYIDQMERTMGSMASEKFKTLPPGWARLISSLNTFSPIAQKVSELDSRTQVAMNAVTAVITIIIEQIERDEKVDNLGAIMDDLYSYVLDLSSTQKILSFQKTLERLLAQTTECAYFIAEYKRVSLFAQRMAENILVSRADAMIAKFESAFGELKIELILGSTLQTTVVTFRILQKVENIENLMYIDYLPSLKNVGWDSSKTCLRGTRENTIGTVINWASKFTDAATTSKIFVLSGPSSCGKSSVVHTVSQSFHEQNRLGAAVILHPGVQGVTAQTISSTIIEQLASYDPQLRAKIADKIKSDKSLASADIGRQFRSLIVDVVSAEESQMMMIGPVLIVIDGLHTVTEDEQHKLLTTIADHSNKLPSNFRILITSLKGDMIPMTLGPVTKYEMQEIGYDDVKEGHERNVGDYASWRLTDLYSKKSDLSERYPMETLHSQLTQRAKGMHFWITMIHHSLLCFNSNDASVLLSDLLSNKLPLSKEDAMDQLYRAILKPIRYLSLSSQNVFDILIKSPKPLAFPHLCQLACIPLKSKGTELDGVADTLKRLTLIRQQGLDDQGAPLFGVHPSLEDFLTNPRRCYGTGLYIDRQLPSKSLPEICLDIMNKLLKHNICQFGDKMALNNEVPDLAERIKMYIPVTLQDACCSWIPCLIASDCDLDGNLCRKLLDEFMLKHLLHWIEVRSLLGRFEDIVTDLLSLVRCMKQDRDAGKPSTAYILAMEAVHFVEAFSHIVSKAALQTYISALPLFPSDTLLFRTYSHETVANRSSLISSAQFEWVANGTTPTQKLLGVPSLPTSSLTSASSHIALKTVAHDISVWDSRSQDTVVRAFNNVNGEAILSADVSPDGMFLANGNHNITVYDMQSGEAFREFNDQTFEYPLLLYSADGKRLLAVDSSEIAGTFCLWDVDAGTLLQKFAMAVCAHTSLGVAMSLDGGKIAVHDDVGVTVLDMDVPRGQIKNRQLEGPHGFGKGALRVARLAWSRDGTRLATASAGDKVVSVWALRRDDGSWAQSRVGLEGWAQPSCLTFSPDLALLAGLQSSGEGKWIHIWDTHTGKLVSRNEVVSAHERATHGLFFLSEDQDHDRQLVLLGVGPEWETTVWRFFDHSPAYLAPPLAGRSIRPAAPTIRVVYATPRPWEGFAAFVDGDGWACTAEGERVMWVPYAGFEVVESAEGGPTGESSSRVIEIRAVKSKDVVLRYVVIFDARLSSRQ